LGLWRGTAEGDHSRDVDDRSFAALNHARHSGPDQHRRSRDLYVDQLSRFVCGKLRDRHVVRNSGIVHEHRQWPRRADLSDDVDAFVRGQIGRERLDLDVRERSGQFLESIHPSAHGHKVVAIGGKPTGEGATDT
jgi:hypothetical protein